MWWRAVLSVVMAVVGLASAVSIVSVVQDEWELFKLEHGKQHTSKVEDNFRMKIYLENKMKVLEHNKRYYLNQTSFKLEMNHFGDMLKGEIASSMNGLKGNADQKPHSVYIPPDDDVKLPSSVDWRKKGAVSRVKDQGQCSSGWAFGTTGALEGQRFRKSGYVPSLSEQNLIDCCHLCFGCSGGRMDSAYTYIIQNGGIDSESYYPYEGRNNVCRYNPIMSVAKVAGYVSIPSGDEKALKAAVANIGPIAIAIDASLTSLHYYHRGIYYDAHCSSTHLTHGALVVGYGTERGVDYWIVKNSWTPYWGEQGYIRIARNHNNQCGIATNALYPLL